MQNQNVQSSEMEVKKEEEPNTDVKQYPAKENAIIESPQPKSKLTLIIIIVAGVVVIAVVLAVVLTLT